MSEKQAELKFFRDNPVVLKEVNKLRRTEDKLRDAIYENLRADGGNLYPSDIVLVGAANRTFDVLGGFIDALGMKNYTIAAASLRMQIDTLLKLDYLRTSEAATKEFLLADKFSDLKHTDEERLRDRKLVELSSKTFPWIGSLYERASDYTHFSKAQIYDKYTPTKDGEARSTVGRGDPNLTSEKAIKLIEANQVVLNGIVAIFEAFAENKKNKTAGRNTKNE